METANLFRPRFNIQLVDSQRVKASFFVLQMESKKRIDKRLNIISCLSRI